jgi:hypothetical protein
LAEIIAARRYDELARRLPRLSDAEIAGLRTADLLNSLAALSDIDRRAAPPRLLAELRRRRPTDPEFAVLVAAELALNGLPEDAAALIDRLLSATSRKGVLLRRWIGQLAAMGLTGEARSQLARWPKLARLPGPQLSAARIDVAERRFAAAEARLQRLVALGPDAPEGAGSLLVRVQIYAALGERFAAAAARNATPDYAVYVINLDEHPARLAQLAGQLPAGAPALQRVPGVRGRYLPDVAAEALAGPGAAARKGTLGCFLAHLAAWERLAASGEAHGLILEDDVRLDVGLPPTIAALGLPAGYDLCFAGRGMEPDGIPVPAPEPLILPVADAVAAMPPDWTAPGGYGYFLSRDGVRKLLGLVRRDGCFGDVDWRMVAYAIGRPRYGSLRLPDEARALIEGHAALLRTEDNLAGYCFLPGLFGPGRVGSVRKNDNAT